MPGHSLQGTFGPRGVCEEEEVSSSNKGAKSSGCGEELGLRTPFRRGNHQDPSWKAEEAQVQTIEHSGRGCQLQSPAPRERGAGLGGGRREEKRTGRGWEGRRWAREGEEPTYRCSSID